MTPIDKAHVDNVVRVVLQASDEERVAGILWYPEYAANIIDFGSKHGLSEKQSLAVFAVLSQRTRIVANWRHYKAVVATRNVTFAIGAFPDVKTKCAAILVDSTGDPGQYCRGDKIASFYANLAGDPNRVTVDRHAISAVYNRMIEKVGPASAYYYCEKVFQVAAAIVELTPRETQAVAWVVWRRMKGLVDGEIAV